MSKDLKNMQETKKALKTAPAKKLSEKDKREAFRIFWAQSKSKYGKSKDLENILWLHLKAIKMDEPNNFEKGLINFGLEKTVK